MSTMHRTGGERLPCAPAQPALLARARDERGIALVVALLSMLLMTALGMALVATTMTETRISGNYSYGTEALYAADAVVERIMQDLLTVPDWNNVLAGTTTSSFIDGASGVRTLPDGQSLNLTQLTNTIRCGTTSTCTDAQMNAATEERPWAANNPRWQLYAYAPLNQMLPTDSINSSMYVVLWVADDPSEKDGAPLIDTNGVLSMIAHAYGPGGVRRVIEVTVARTDSTEIERGYTGQRGQDEQNRRARKAAVQTPGKTLTRQEISIN
jgi:Tfp pilus assembly protein PilX